jgi:hypothetical protein
MPTTASLTRGGGISSCRPHCQHPKGHHWRASHTQSGRCRMRSSQQMLNKLATVLNKLAELFCLSCYSPGVRCSQPRSPARWSGSPWTRSLAPPEEFRTHSCTPNPAPPPRTRVCGAAPPGGRRRASRRLYSVRTPRGWLGPARGEFLVPNWPLGPPPVLLTDFWATGRAINPLDFVRWVVPIKARGRYTLFSAIHRAGGVRRVRKGDFWKCV